MTLEVLKNRLDKCPSDMTGGTGGLDLRWREGEDVTDTCLVAWGNRQHTNPIYHIPNCKIILNNILRLLKPVKIVACLEKKTKQTSHTFLLIMLF